MIVVGDIGGTNARFATINQNDPISFSSLKKVRKFECYDFKNFDYLLNFFDFFHGHIKGRSRISAAYSDEVLNKWL